MRRCGGAAGRRRWSGRVLEAGIDVHLELAQLVFQLLDLELQLLDLAVQRADLVFQAVDAQDDGRCRRSARGTWSLDRRRPDDRKSGRYAAAARS